MKTVIQRVLRCSVSVDGSVISSIGKGLLVLIGISRDDTKEDMEYMVRKILNVKFFDDGNGKKWCRSLKDEEYEVLCVSQFTLCHSLKGNKLDFHHAMKADESKLMYNEFLEKLKKDYKPDLVKDGLFGAYMSVDLINDGPITINLMSPREEKAEKQAFLEKTTGS